MKLTPIFIINWIVNSLMGRQQRVVVDGISTSYLSINRDIPQGTAVIGPILFLIMINDIKAVNPSGNLLIKYADDISLKGLCQLGGMRKSVQLRLICI